MSAAVDLPADVETVFAVLTSAAWPQALDQQLHDGSRLVSAVGTPGGGTTVRTSRSLPEGVPGYLKRFTPADGRVTQTDTWGAAVAGVRTGTWAVTFPGSPGVIGGSTTIAPGPTGCRWTVTGTVSIRLPVVGGRVEGFLAPLLEKLVRRQGEVLRAQLPG
jgi:hypothetical protein